MHKRIVTTLPKAKAARSVAEKMVTIGKRAQAAMVEAAAAQDDKSKASAVAKSVHFRRLASARLRQSARTNFQGTPTIKGKVLREKWSSENDVVRILCDRIAPIFKERAGGYTRIVKLAQRQGDSAQEAILEWVDSVSQESKNTVATS